MNLITSIADPANIFGENSAPTAGTPNAKKVGRQYLNLIKAFSQGEGTLFDTQAQWEPQFAGLEESLLNDALPTMTATLRGANPGQTALLDQLTKTASTQLGLGTQLDPADTSRITSSVRSDWANRGLGTSAPAQLDEAMQLYGGGQQALAQREGQAASVTNLNEQDFTAPLFGLAQNAIGSGPTLINPSQAYDAFNTSYNANAAANIANANNAAAIMGGQMSY